MVMDNKAKKIVVDLLLTCRDLVASSEVAVPVTKPERWQSSGKKPKPIQR